MVSFLVYHLVGSHFGILKDFCYRYEACRATKTYSFSRLKPYEKKSTHVISVVILSWYSLSTLTLQYVKASSKFMDHKTVCREMQYIHATRISGRRKSKLNKVRKYGGKYATTWVCTQALLFMILWIFLCSFFYITFLTTKRIDHKIPHCIYWTFYKLPRKEVRSKTYWVSEIEYRKIACFLGVMDSTIIA